MAEPLTRTRRTPSPASRPPARSLSPRPRVCSSDARPASRPRQKRRAGERPQLAASSRTTLACENGACPGADREIGQERMCGVAEPGATQQVLCSTIPNYACDRAGDGACRTIEDLSRLEPCDQGVERRVRHADGLPATPLASRANRVVTRVPPPSPSICTELHRRAIRLSPTPRPPRSLRAAMPWPSSLTMISSAPGSRLA